MILQCNSPVFVAIAQHFIQIGGTPLHNNFGQLAVRVYHVKAIIAGDGLFNGFFAGMEAGESDHIVQARRQVIMRRFADSFAIADIRVQNLGRGGLHILRQNGVIVLLDASLDTLERRLDGVSDRPLLQRDDRQEFLRALYAKRMPLYRTVAQLCVDADHDPDTVSEQILQKAELFFGENT